MKKIASFVCFLFVLTIISAVCESATYRNGTASEVSALVRGVLTKWRPGETKAITGYTSNTSLTKVSDAPSELPAYTSRTISAENTWSTPIGPATSETVFRARGTFAATLTIQELPHGEDPVTSTAWRDVYESGSAVTMTAADTKIVYDSSGTFYRIGCKTGEYTSGTITVEVDIN